MNLQAGFAQQTYSPGSRQHLKNVRGGEIIYHVFLRSFYDGNGDLNGDLNGLREKLDYIRQLGATAILVTPVCASAYYHNYFADDFEKIDPSYGTMTDWLGLVGAIHAHGMKIYLDVEIQYVTDRQIWYKDSYENPKSPYSDYIIYNGPGNTRPEPIIYNISTLKGYNDSTREVATVNLYSKNVLAYFYKLFRYWMDPGGNGNFSDGVDGFRIDHMMDNLDNKNILPHLFSRFWCPLITKLKKVNPRLVVIAEQANWASFGDEYFKDGCVDRVFAFNLQQAIVSFNKERIAAMADSTFGHTPPGKEQIVFIENHDMERFASAVDQNPGKLRVGAVLNLFTGGIPSIYYGQELGMYGKGGFGRFGNTDGNDIPQREAFEWYKEDTGRGMALWYRNTGPWWDSTNLKPADGISLEEEKADPNSLWNFYREMIRLRQAHPAFASGAYRELKNDNEHVISFLRYLPGRSGIVVVNLSDQVQKVTADLGGTEPAGKKFIRLYGPGDVRTEEGRLITELPPFGVLLGTVDIR